MHFFSQEGPHNGPLGGLWAQFSALWVPSGARPTMSVVAIIVVIIVARARYYCRTFLSSGQILLSSRLVVGPNIFVEAILVSVGGSSWGYNCPCMAPLEDPFIRPPTPTTQRHDKNLPAHHFCCYLHINWTSLHQLWSRRLDGMVDRDGERFVATTNIYCRHYCR